jgi:hypothetical protein
MRFGFMAAGLACLSFAVAAESVHSVKLINDTHTRIVSFAIAPAGDGHWTEVEFHDPLLENQNTMLVEIHDGKTCLYDFRTTFSDGRYVLARNVDLCRLRTYRPGRRFYDGHPGGVFLP